MERKELIEKFIKFFEKKNHKKVPNASLIPENDPTVLFTTAGMHPLVPYLLGQSHPQGKRLVGIQRCVRTGDIDSVGDNVHHTFFEMLGNWSLGDYFKEDSIRWSFEFLTEVLGLDKNKLAVSVFSGNKDAPRDNESAKIWKSIGFSDDKIVFLEDNWWGPAGQTGPCGPDTEIFYWTGEEIPEKFDPSDKRWVEIWNNVFMEYVKRKDGSLELSPQKNVDTGMGLERTLAVMKGTYDNYKTDSWEKIIREIERISGKEYEGHEKSMRIIADHIKAAVFMINDGVFPGKSEREYVLRRLIRRAVRFGRKIGIKNFTQAVAVPVFEIYDDYRFDREKIMHELKKEESLFLERIEKGMRVFEKFADSEKIDGKTAFLLYQSYGFPIELTLEVAKERGLEVDREGFLEEQKKHQEISRTATAGKFKSGLADESEATTRLHTATHLLLAALNRVLEKPPGLKEIEQRGSNITAERARFDFTFDRKLTDKEIQKIEEMVNGWIREGSDVERKEMTLEEARKFGASGIFEEKYKQIGKISVYVIGDGKISKEICSGPHVKSLKELQGYRFKIAKQKSVGAGVRRVKVVLEKLA
ncbi:alanine--tRNA ligase [Candidatus Pacearchaeota archaeon]|nr:MAG: alanine--tRNA ligase [Candidatus Pacearchaeota archaeon]